MNFLEWAVLVKGSKEEVERRVLAIYLEDGDAPDFAVAPGRGDWHVVYGTVRGRIGTEMGLADLLTEKGDEAVYALGLVEADEPYVFLHRRDTPPEFLDEDPDELAERLGCTLPWPPPVSRDPPLEMRSVARLEGLSVEETRAAYETLYGKSPPPSLHFEEVPGGVLLRGDEGNVGSTDVDLSEAQPKVTVYSVLMSAQLERFIVWTLRAGGAVEHFSRPPRQDPFAVEVDEVKGQSEPEAILNALGIRKAHFGF